MFQIVSVIVALLATGQYALGQQQSASSAIDTNIANLQVQGLLGRWFQVYTSSFLLRLNDQACTVLDIMQSSSQQIDQGGINSGVAPVPAAGDMNAGIAPGVADAGIAGQQMPINSGVMGGGANAGMMSDQHFADWKLYFK